GEPEDHGAGEGSDDPSRSHQLSRFAAVHEPSEPARPNRTLQGRTSPRSFQLGRCLPRRGDRPGLGTPKSRALTDFSATGSIIDRFAHAGSSKRLRQTATAAGTDPTNHSAITR